MKPHVTASTASVGTRSEDDTAGSATNGAPAGFKKNTRKQGGSSGRSLALASVNVRTHTLVLTGELDHRSAHALEAEIERLCEEGVTGITLDLRDLTYIDAIGVAVIAFRCGLCKRRGYDFSLIPGSPYVHRAFEQAGVAELLPFQEDEVEPPPPPALVLSRRSGEEQ